MADDRTSHIKVDWSYQGDQFTSIYAISEDLLSEANAWSSKQKDRTGRDLVLWLVRKGCRLDSPDGAPAYVARNADGSMEEQYYRDGKLHREHGPAVICHNPHNPDAQTLERYYYDGQFVKVQYSDQPPLSAIPGVTVQRPAPKTSKKPGTPGPA